MTEQLINFETAKLAKEKGFNIVGDVACREDEFGIGKISTNSTFNYTPEKYPYNLVRQSLLQKWLRDTHNIVITVASIFKDETCKEIQYWWWIQGHEEDNDETEVYFNTYEEALEAALQESLKLI